MSAERTEWIGRGHWRCPDDCPSGYEDGYANGWIESAKYLTRGLLVRGVEARRDAAATI